MSLGSSFESEDNSEVSLYGSGKRDEKCNLEEENNGGNTQKAKDKNFKKVHFGLWKEPGLTISSNKDVNENLPSEENEGRAHRSKLFKKKQSTPLPVFTEAGLATRSLRGRRKSRQKVDRP